MTDTAEIRDLYTRYTYNGDRGRLADLAACFAEDSTLEFPGGKGTGPAGVAEALTLGVAGDPARTVTRHHVTNPLIDVSADGQSATARAYFSVYCNNGLDHVGTYNDQHRLTPARLALRLPASAHRLAVPNLDVAANNKPVR